MLGLADGGYLIGGSTKSFGAPGWDYYIVRTDCTGNEVWSGRWGTDRDDVLSDLLQTSDGGYVLYGSSLQRGLGPGQLMLVRLASEQQNNVSDGEFGLSPDNFILESPYPNPFNSATRISLRVPDEASVQVNAFDLTGRQIARIFNGRLPRGAHHLVWISHELPAGLYLIYATNGNSRRTEKVALIR
jgi:hypothetical protein